MKNITSNFSKLRDNLETVAFLVSKGNYEQKAHSKVVQSLVLLAQIELEVNYLLNINELDFADDSGTSINSALLSGKKNNIATTTNNDLEVATEIKKVQRRIPKWFKNPSQYNSTILNGFLELSEKETQVTTQMLRNKCHIISDFDGNYNQMKNFGEKNHGKVFEERDGIITLWEPVEKFILELYLQQKSITNCHGARR